MFSSSFTITGITCEACVKLIKKRLQKIQNVTEVSLELSGNLGISSDRQIEKTELLSALEGTDYKVL
ncbi:heavy-metal-associated domain-containing protein [Candidatus Peregrinibacteria bacterium]|nr:heavy-metal-associated domain-containing protein [Candidatus Peregrinibacteria bacterium]